MNGGADETEVEPPDENVLAVDPTGRYICYKESVGEGAFKTVYKAFDEIDGIEVAWSQIKVTGPLSSPAAIEMLRSELHLLKSLKHNNIIKYYNSWEDDSSRTINIITELFSSGSLRQYRLKHKKVDMRALKGWARQILSGLEYLHSQNPPVIHRDIKCDNIFINGNHGEVKIGDLGLATVMHQPRCRAMTGTPEFMAPEYYEEEYNELVDIYSFGMCMLEMVSLEYPYSECDSALRIIKKVISGKKPAGLSKVTDPELKAFIETCITNVSERPSASELLRGSFLRTDGTNGSRAGPILPSAEAVASNSVPVKKLVQVEQPVKSFKNMESPQYVNLDDDKLIVNTSIQSCADGGFLSVTSEVKKLKKDKKFLLTAQREGEGLVAFDLHIATGNAKGRHIDFTFYVDTDTASSIASELVEQDEIGTDDAKLISEMIESLLVNLSLAWNASVASNHSTAFDDNKTCGPEFEGTQSAAAYEAKSPLSSQITWEALDISKPAAIGPSSADTSLQHMHEPSEIGSHDVISCSFPGPSIPSTDDLSDPSLMSVSSFDENDKKLSAAFLCSTEEGCYSLHHFESESKTDVVYNQKGAAALEAAQNMDATGPVAVGKFGDRDDDEKLSLELEIIELLYQQMINDIYQKKNEALVRARIGAANKKLLAPLRVTSTNVL